MCAICGMIWCPTGCPNYDVRNDPGVSGYCEICGGPILGVGYRYCLECENTLNDMKDNLVFDRERHEYFFDGEQVPCVSDIIAVFGKDIEEGDDLENVMDAAAERGTVCHKVLEMLLRGIEPEYPAAYEPYVDAIRLFLSEHSISPIFIEEPIYNPRLNYAGTPDLLCVFDGRLTILDYKFVSQIAKTKVKAQLNAYCKAYEEQDVYPEFMYAVQFLKDGTYRLYPVKWDDTELEVALKLWELKNKKHPRGAIA